MPTNYLGEAANATETGVTITCPADGDSRTAASVNTPLQTLADYVQQALTAPAFIAACNWDTVSGAIAGDGTRNIAMSEDGTLLVAVGGASDDSSRGVIYSVNGKDWTAASSVPAGVALQAVAHSGTIWVAVSVGTGGGSGKGAILSSTDGSTWTARTNPDAGGASNNLNCVAWGDSLGKFVALGQGAWLHSADGITWTEITSPTSSEPLAVVWAPSVGRFVAATNGSGVYYSTNGTSWTAATTQLTAGAGNKNSRHVCFGSLGGTEMFVATCVGAAAPSAECQVWTSPDGDVWTKRLDTAVASQNSGAAVGGGVAIINTHQSLGYVSRDGINWEPRVLASSTMPADSNNNQSYAAGRFNRFFIGAGTGGLINRSLCVG